MDEEGFERETRGSPPRCLPGRGARRRAPRADRSARRGSAETARGQSARGGSGGGLEEPLSRSARAGAQRCVRVTAAEAHTVEAAARDLGRTTRRGTSSRGVAGSGWRRMSWRGRSWRERPGSGWRAGAGWGGGVEVEAKGWQEGVGEPESSGRQEKEPRRRAGFTAGDANGAGESSRERRGESRRWATCRKRRPAKREVHAEMHEEERATHGSRERATRERAREHAHTRVRRGRACPLYGAREESKRAREPSDNLSLGTSVYI